MRTEVSRQRKQILEDLEGRIKNGTWVIKLAGQLGRWAAFRH